MGEPVAMDYAEKCEYDFAMITFFVPIVLLVIIILIIILTQFDHQRETTPATDNYQMGEVYK